MKNGDGLIIRQLTSCVGMIKKSVYRWLVFRTHGPCVPTERNGSGLSLGAKKRRSGERREETQAV